MIKKLGLFIIPLILASSIKAEVILDNEITEEDILLNYSEEQKNQPSNSVLLPPKVKTSNRTSRSATTRSINTASTTSKTQNRNTTQRNKSDESTRSSSLSNRSATVNRSNKNSERTISNTTRSNVSRSAVNRSQSNNRSATVNRSATGISNNTKLNSTNLPSNSTTSTTTNENTTARIGMTTSSVKSRSGATTAKTISSLSEDKSNFDSCKSSYFDCMNQFCTSINANANSCNCSTRMTSFKQTETNLSEATTQLYQVIQNITYIGYTTNEIKAMFTASEGELAISKDDTSENKAILDEIDSLLSGNDISTTSIFNSSLNNDVNKMMQSMSNTYSALDSTISNSTNDTNNTNPETLNKTAQKSCNSILTTCKDNNVDTETIKQLYNLEMTKDCDTYEKALNNKISSMKKNLLAADATLKKARLQAEQDKNKYDFATCVSKLEECMTADSICGSEYEACLDLSGQIISSSGEIISNANINKLVLALEADGTNNNKFATWFQNKIGTSKKNGVCRGVMELCQKYSYKNGKYYDKNDVITAYINSALAKISEKQITLKNEYSSDCLSSVSSCYTSNAKSLAGYNENITLNHIQTVLNEVCRDITESCANSIYSNSTTTPEDAIKYISSLIYKKLSSTYQCPTGQGFDEDKAKCIICETKQNKIYDANTKTCISCSEAHRNPSNPTGCGTCLDGFTENFEGICVNKQKLTEQCKEAINTCIETDRYCQDLTQHGFDIIGITNCYENCKSINICNNLSPNIKIQTTIGYTIFSKPNNTRVAYTIKEHKDKPIFEAIINLLNKYFYTNNWKWNISDCTKNTAYQDIWINGEDTPGKACGDIPTYY